MTLKLCFLQGRHSPGSMASGWHGAPCLDSADPHHVVNRSLCQFLPSEFQSNAGPCASAGVGFVSGLRSALMRSSLEIFTQHLLRNYSWPGPGRQHSTLCLLNENDLELKQEEKYSAVLTTQVPRAQQLILQSMYQSPCPTCC